MAEPCDLSAVELRELIKTKQVTPGELLESCITRIEKVNGAVNAVVATDYERAREAADAALDSVLRGEELGLLHGLPVGIKDLNETAGLRTTYGSLIYADHVPDQDDHLTVSVRAAGGIIAGKTNTPEFGAGANTVNSVYGFTGNPFDPQRICGGSSGGSAVALATSMFPLASGSDLGGSLRTPAAYCGVVGFRPSPGLVADETKTFAWSPLSVQGPMARSVPDLCLMLAAMTGEDVRDPLTSRQDADTLLSPPPVELKDLRVAFSEDLGFAPIDKGIRETFGARTKAIEDLFASCELADPELGDAEQTFEVLRSLGFMAQYTGLLNSHPEQVGQNVAANVELGLAYSAHQVALALQAQTELYRRFLAFMETYDLLICPTASVPPFGKDQLYPKEINGEPLPTYIGWMGITYGLTLTTHPIVVLPCGLDQTGAPFGIQIVGRMGRESELLAAAAVLEEALQGIEECRRPMPDLESLAAMAG